MGSLVRAPSVGFLFGADLPHASARLVSNVENSDGIFADRVL